MKTSAHHRNPLPPAWRIFLHVALAWCKKRKRTSAGLLILAFTTLFLRPASAEVGITGNFTNIVGTGNDLVSMTTTMDVDTSSIPMETAGFRKTVVYNGYNPYELPTGEWLDFYYNQYSTYSYADTGVAETAHGIGFFSRLHGNDDNQGFMAAIEGNTLCTSTYTSAGCVGLIAHTKYDNHGNAARIPNAPIIGTESRIDITSDGFGSAAFAEGQVIHFRADPWSIGGHPGRKYSLYNEYDNDIQIVNLGNIIKLPVSRQMDHNETLDISKSCGGYIVVTSTGVIVGNAHAFTTTSIDEPAGTYNDGCSVLIVNGNLVGGRSITFKYGVAGGAGSNFLSATGADIVLGAMGGAMQVISYPAGGLWIQATPATK